MKRLGLGDHHRIEQPRDRIELPDPIVQPGKIEVVSSLSLKVIEEARKKTTGDVQSAHIAPLQCAVPASLSSKDSFDVLLDDLWARRNDLQLQPQHTMVYRLCGLEVPEESPVKLLPFCAELKQIVDALPPWLEAGTKTLGATKLDVSKGLEKAANGELKGIALSRLDWGVFRFHNKSFDPTADQFRIFLNTQPEHALEWTRWLAEEVLGDPKKFPGVDVVEVSGPGGAGRADDITILTSTPEARDRLLEWIDKKATKHPETIEGETIPGAEGARPGVSWGAEPDVSRYPGESFRSVRARVLFNALRETVVSGGDRADLEKRALELMKEAGLDPTAPHLNGAATKASSSDVVPLEGAVVPEPGVYQAVVDAWGKKVTVEIEITPEVSAILKKQKRMAFIPSEGSIAFAEVDATRDPPRRVVKSSFSITHSADQRYKIEMGEAGPRILAYDEKARAFYVPKKVRLVPNNAYRPFKAVPIGEATPERKPTQPLHSLVRQFVEPNRTPTEVANAAAKIEKYLSDEKAYVVSSIPLEEGVNGKAIVKLSNGAVALWKPSSAEFPELMRTNLDPDHFARREAFAYEVSKAMGHLGRVPPAVYRDLDGQPGTLIALVRSSEAGVFSDSLEPLLEADDSKAYRSIALLDHVLGSLDRHQGNVLFTKGNAIAIDHGLCLPRRHGDQGAHCFLFDHDFKLNGDELAELDKLLAAKAELTKTGLALGIHPKSLGLMFERAETFKKAGAVSSYWRQDA
jgi:hypothetical protein